MLFLFSLLASSKNMTLLYNIFDFSEAILSVDKEPFLIAWLQYLDGDSFDLEKIQRIFRLTYRHIVLNIKLSAWIKNDIPFT